MKLESTLVTGAILVLSAVAAAQGAPVVGQDQRVRAPHPTIGEGLGEAIGLDGDTLVLGARGSGTQSGRAYVYRRESGSWVFDQLLAPTTTPRERFGWSVALDGEVLVVGSAGWCDMLCYPEVCCPAGLVRGYAYVYHRDASGWNLRARLEQSDSGPDDDFGHAVAVNGEFLVVGAPRDDDATMPSQAQSSTFGSAHVYRLRGRQWTEVARLRHSDPRPGDRFGYSVAVSGGTVAVGAPRDEVGGEPNAGSVTIFEWDGTAFRQQARVDGEGELFGWSIALDGDVLIAGVPGHFLDYSGRADVFERSGTRWARVASLQGSDPPETETTVGTTVSLDGDTAVIGTREMVNLGLGTWNAAWAFRRIGDDWIESAKLVVDHSDGRFGLVGDTAVSEGRVAAGARLDRLGPHFQFVGAAYVYDLLQGAPACFGDGTGAPCPCNNPSPNPREGCAHSGGVGMRIWALGTGRVSADDLEVVVDQVPRGDTGFFASGTLASVGVPLHDGLQCVGGDTRMYPGIFQTTGVASSSSFVALEGSGSYFVPGGTYGFQYFARDPHGSACGTGGATSPAYWVTLTP